MWAGRLQPGLSRLRLGEDPKPGNVRDVRNFLASKNIVYQTRVLFNTVDHLQATIGFIGFHDPDNVIAAILNSPERGEWLFEVKNNKKGKVIPTGFIHTPGEWHEYRVATAAGASISASLFIDGKQVATVSGPSVPKDGLATEFQIWNKEIQTGAWSQPEMYVDYLYVRQDR